MEILQNIFSIILFVLSLSVLVMIHELGHFGAAKVFKVYCSDFSIGFGKALVHKKRKDGETYFSLRIVPFGGFVAMAEDEGETPEGVKVPKERSINGVRKWKAAIIMVSGVVMNVVLAILLLYISSQCFPIDQLYIDSYNVASNSPAEIAGVKPYNYDTKEGDVAVMTYYYYDENGFISDSAALTQDELNAIASSAKSVDLVFTTDAVVTLNDDTTISAYVVMDTSKVTLADLNIKTSMLTFRHKEIVEGKDKYINNIAVDGIKSVSINAKFKHLENDTWVDSTVNPIVINKVTVQGSDTPVLEGIGLSFFNHQHWASFQEAWSLTFNKFGTGASAIFRALGDLFTGKGWDGVGGIISIYSSTTMTLNTMGFGYYLYYWGVISINLAIVNLLPFPGLDGWQLLVIAIEGISRKKIPDKVKNIVSYIGLGLLFALMALLIVKDIFFPIV